jgi:type IV fimbrial biogenesis protein FimT
VRRLAGFTLWELLWTLLVAAAVLTIGVPAVHGFVLDSRRTADVNGFVLAVQLARSEAFKRGRTVVLCKSADLSRCGDDSTRFDAGWIVFVNTDDLRPPQRAVAEPLLLAHAPQMAGSIVANRSYFEFRPFRRRSVNGTVTFCDSRGPAAARVVVVSYTGRPRVDAAGGGARPPCAALP